jgi:Cu-processing system ATP-binding protein
MIRFENIKKKFGKLEVLKGINLELRSNQAVAIIGPNGSGKTTMLKSLLGLVVPDEGEIYVDDQQVSHGWHYRQKIGYMPQIGRFPENIRIGELFEMMKDIRPDVTEYDTALYDAYELDKIADKKLGTLSGGTKQKVGSALAFLFKPQVLILDEPTAGLDPGATELIKDKILEEKHNGKLIIITSHIMSDIEALADTIVYIIEGKIKFVSPIAEVKSITGEATFSRAMAKLMEAA